MKVLNRLAKWRTIFAGWQLGTRSIGDPECQAVRDHREVTIFLRNEVNALATLLVAKGVFTSAEWTQQLIVEAEHLQKAYERQFPGCLATDHGMQIDTTAIPWMKEWKP